MSAKEIRSIGVALVVLGGCLCIASFRTAPICISGGWTLINYGVGYFLGAICMLALLRGGERP